MRGAAGWVLAGVIALAFALPARAECRLALLLALDVSSSVDDGEYLLQRNGLAAALIAPEVGEAFLSSPVPVALAAYEWSGRYNHATVLDWRLIRTEADLVAAAEAVAGTERSETRFPTALGFAMGHAASIFRSAPGCARRTIDVSGDGENNDGFSPEQAYAHFPLGGVTVNALAIGGSVDLDRLVAYFRARVIRGPGAFVETAADYADFERAIRRKLEREVSGFAVSRLDLRR